MIELRINNEPLDMSPDTSISLDINNPLLSRDVIPGSYSLPFTLPATGKNRRLLGYPERLDLLDTTASRYACVMHINGIFWRNGQLILRKLTSESLSVNFQTDVSLLKDQLDVSLRDLNHSIEQLVDTPTVISNTHVFDGVVTDQFLAPDSADIDETKSLSANKPYKWYRWDGTLPIEHFFAINGQKYEQSGPGWQNVVRDEILASDSDVKMQYFGANGFHNYFFWVNSGSWDTPMDITFDDGSPFVLEEYAAQVFSDQAIAEFNARYASASISNNPFVLPTFWNPDLLGEERNNRGLHNYYDADASAYQLYHTRADQEYTYGIVPMYHLGYILDQIQAVTGIRIVGTIRQAFFLNLVFANNHALNFFDGTGFPLLAAEINPANHLPDMTILDFILDINKYFCLGCYYNEDRNELEFYHLADLLEGNPDDITELSSPDYEKDVANVPDGTVFSSAFPTSDKMFEKEGGAELAPLSLGGGKDKISTKLSTLYTRKKFIFKLEVVGFNINIFQFNQRIPVSEEEGTLGNEAGDPAPRLLYYHGMQPDANGKNFPFASSDGKSLDGTASGISSLAWQGDNGLFEKRWKQWYNFEQQRQKVSFKTYWKMPRLLNHTHDQHYMYRGKTFLVRRVQMGFSMRKGLLPQTLDVDTIE